MPVKTCETCNRPVVVRRHRYGSGATVATCSSCPEPPPPAPADTAPIAGADQPRTGWSVPEVVEWVAAGGDPPARARTALRSELDRDNTRRTLVARLQRIIDEAEADG